MAEEASEGAPLGIWIGLIIIAAVSFYCQAAVTEERFVPALNVIANEFNIPDDVAGATLMAAGASSPELFSSFVALFITHSSLGLGTIVGSEIFNQLIICAGAVFASKSGRLQLDKAIVTREVFFYGLSIAVLLVALRDTGPVEGDDEDHIFISFGDACIVFVGYVLYVWVMANFDKVKEFFLSRSKGFAAARPDYGATRGDKSKRTSFENLPDMPFLKEKAFQAEPSGNFEQLVSYYRTASGLEYSGRPSDANEATDVTPRKKMDKSMRQTSLIGASIRNVLGYSDGASIRVFNYEINISKPSDQHELYEVLVNSFNDTLSVFLWQRSFFYTNAKFARAGWHLRWFTFTHDAVYSVPDRTNFASHKMKYPRFKEIEIDEKRLIIKFPNPLPGKRNFYLMAPSAEVFEAVVEKCEAIMETREVEDEEGMEPEDEEEEEDMEFDDSDAHVSLVEFPWSGSNSEIVFHVLLFPLKGLMHLTIPDVRHLDRDGNPTATRGNAFLAIVACLLWLVVGSYAMVASLENLAKLLDIPDAVIGVTVSAAGTSLPNYVASKIAAEKGFGNMAVSNAFGSNTFNIMVGLGLPWVIYTSVGTGFKPYTGLRNEGILESVIILSIVLLIFVVNMLMSGFVVRPWHGYLYIVLYVAYLAFAIGQVYL